MGSWDIAKTVHMPEPNTMKQLMKIRLMLQKERAALLVKVPWVLGRKRSLKAWLV